MMEIETSKAGDFFNAFEEGCDFLIIFVIFKWVMSLTLRMPLIDFYSRKMDFMFQFSLSIFEI